MKNFFIVLIIKLMNIALKLFGKKGGNLLGKFAFDWNPNIFKYFKIDCPIIAVTATNGKTMTNNAIYSVFKEAGYKLTNEVAKAVSEKCAIVSTGPRVMTREEIEQLLLSLK